MTSIVGIRCESGVVVATDSSVTFGDGQFLRTIEQQTEKKLEIIDNCLIIAGTGYVGHHQRFCAAVSQLSRNGHLRGKAALDIGKLIAQAAINDFGQTTPAIHMRDIPFSALVAFPAVDGPQLCEFPGKIGFQPEIKDPKDLWFASAGSGQPITDPFLALFRSIFWKDAVPSI